MCVCGYIWTCQVREMIAQTDSNPNSPNSPQRWHTTLVSSLYNVLNYGIRGVMDNFNSSYILAGKMAGKRNPPCHTSNPNNPNNPNTKGNVLVRIGAPISLAQSTQAYLSTDPDSPDSLNNPELNPSGDAGGGKESEGSGNGRLELVRGLTRHLCRQLTYALYEFISYQGSQGFVTVIMGYQSYLCRQPTYTLYVYMISDIRVIRVVCF